MRFPDGGMYMPLFNMGKINDKINSKASNYKLNKEISDLENKKALLEQAVMNEIGNLQTVISQLYTEIGQITHERFLKSDKILTDEIFEKFDKIAELNESIEAKKVKIVDITSKYDEEISLLRGLAAEGASIAVHSTTTTLCKVCNTPYQADNDVFCGSCGNKL